MPATEDEYNINPAFLPPKELWFCVEPLLPEHKKKTHGRGRPPQSDRKMFNAIFYILRTGIQWKALPRALGAASTVHLRFQQWAKAGVFIKLWKSGILELHIENVLNWSFQSIDGTLTKAPLGKQETGPNPTDRGKKGVKRHLLTEKNGLPISLTITAANVHDVRQAETVLHEMPFLPPLPDYENPQGFCADAGYDSLAVRRLIDDLGYEDHIKSRWDEKQNLLDVPHYRARRWVCERTHSWMNRFRRILTRWEKKKENYEAMLHLCCAFIVWRKSVLFSG
jgi:putative transposase